MDFAPAGYLEDLTDRVKADTALEWDDVAPFFIEADGGRDQIAQQGQFLVRARGLRDLPGRVGAGCGIDQHGDADPPDRTRGAQNLACRFGHLEIHPLAFFHRQRVNFAVVGVMR